MHGLVGWWGLIALILPRTDLRGFTAGFGVRDYSGSECILLEVPLLEQPLEISLERIAVDYLMPRTLVIRAEIFGVDVPLSFGKWW